MMHNTNFYEKDRELYFLHRHLDVATQELELAKEELGKLESVMPEYEKHTDKRSLERKDQLMSTVRHLKGRNKILLIQIEHLETTIMQMKATQPGIVWAFEEEAELTPEEAMEVVEEDDLPIGAEAVNFVPDEHDDLGLGDEVDDEVAALPDGDGIAFEI